MEVVEQIRVGDYFSERVYANGPWEARFIFCGMYGYSPNEVSVTRDNHGSYWCSVGKQPSWDDMWCEL